MPPSPNSASISYRSPKSVPTPSSPAPARRAIVAPKAFEMTGSDQAVTGRVMVVLSPLASDATAAALTSSAAPQLSQRPAPEGFSRLHSGHRIAAISPAVQRCCDAPILNCYSLRGFSRGHIRGHRPILLSSSQTILAPSTRVLRQVFDMKVYQNERFG